MDYYTFTDKLLERLSNELGNNYHIHLEEISQNNSTAEEGFLVQKEGEPISSTYSLGKYYDDYLAGQTMENIIGNILIEHAKFEQLLSFPTPKELSDYSRIKDRLYLRLINRQWNKKYLKDKMYLPFLDLAAVFCMDMRNLSGTELLAEQTGVAVLTEQFRQWDVSTFTVFVDAIHNMEKNGDFVLQKLDEQVSDAKIGTDSKENLSEPEMWLIRDATEQYLNAAALLFPALLENAAKVFRKSFYIIPASVHELLLLPDGEGLKPKELKQMLEKTNHTLTAKEEWLSNSIYHYDAEMKKLSIAV